MDDPQSASENGHPVVTEFVVSEPVKPDGWFTAYWKRIGGGSLTLSILIHAAIVIGALLWLLPSFSGSSEDAVDFLPGGGGGTNGNTRIEKQRARMMAASSPKIRIAGNATNGTIALPDTSSMLMSSSMLAASGRMSGTPGTGGGFGGGHGTGRGTGYGSGMGPGRGPGFTAKFLGLESVGNNIIFCIDTSGSMQSNLKPAGIAAMRKEMEKVISGLPPLAQFNIICFANYGDIFKPKSVMASAENKKEAIAFLSGYFGAGGFGRTRAERFGRRGKDDTGTEFVALLPEDVEELAGTVGSSRIDLAMVAAFERMPSTIYVVSDGAPGTRRENSDRAMDKDDIIELIAEKRKEVMGNGALVVNTITVDSDTSEAKEGAEFMRKLARKFKGKHRTIKPEKI